MLNRSDSDYITTVAKNSKSSSIDSAGRNQSPTIALEQNCTQFGRESTQNDKIVYGDGEYQHQQHQHRLLFRDIKAAATKKLLDKNQGITYLDVIKLADDPRYTPKQAQDVLRNLKIKGKLHTCYRTKPQQYYLSQEDADYAAQKYMRSTHNDPSGVRGASHLMIKSTTPSSLDSCNNKNYPDIDYYKAQNVASVIYYTTSGLGATLLL